MSFALFACMCLFFLHLLTAWPSALNDDMIYSTRVKPISSSPIFNAGTEHFIRDWRTTHVSVVVRDSRMRENDPVLGMVFLKVNFYSAVRVL